MGIFFLFPVLHGEILAYLTIFPLSKWRRFVLFVHPIDLSLGEGERPAINFSLNYNFHILHKLRFCAMIYNEDRIVAVVTVFAFHVHLKGRRERAS